MKKKVYITGYSSVVPKSINDNYPNVFGNRKIQRFSRRSGLLFMAAVKDALNISNLNLNEVESFRTSIILGEYLNQKQDLHTIIEVLKDCIVKQEKNNFDDGLYHSNAIKHWGTTGVITNLPNITGFLCALSVQSRGYLSTELLTCAGGLFSIADGYEKIRNGYIDVAIVGGTSSKVNYLEEIKYRKMGFYDENDYMISEGAGVIILESENSILGRNFKPFAEIIGSANSFSPLTYTQKDFDPDSIEFLIKKVLSNSGLNREQAINYYSGSFSKKNICKELKLVKSILESCTICKTAKEKVGYTFAASGVLELIEALKSFEDNEVNITLINALGIGGHNASIALKGV